MPTHVSKNHRNLVLRQLLDQPEQLLALHAHKPSLRGPSPIADDLQGMPLPPSRGREEECDGAWSRSNPAVLDCQLSVSRWRPLPRPHRQAAERARGADVRWQPHSLIIGRALVMHPDALARSAAPGMLPGLYQPTASRAEFTIGMGRMIFQRFAVRFREVPDIDRGLQIFRSAARPEDPSECAHLIEPRSG
jgi:hypothetical protein